MIYNLKIYKRFRRIAFATLLLMIGVFFVTSCTDFLKGKPNTQKVVNYKSNKLACLNDISKSFDRFLQSEATLAEVDQTFDCVDKTFDELQLRAEGSESSQYFTISDIHNILEDFVPSAKINDQASLGILRFKSAIIGGNKDRLTKSEINNVREYLKILKAEVKKILPYASLLNVKLQKQILTKNQIEVGYAQLASSLKVLITQSRLLQSDYGFDELKQLIIDMGLVASEQKGMVNLLGEIKKLFVGPVQLTTEADYFSLIDSFMGIFKVYSFNQQEYIGFALKAPSILDNTIDSAMDLIDVLQNSLQYKKTQIISSESVDSLISVLLQKNLVSFVENNADKNLLNLPISAETLTTFYKSIFAKVFDAGISGDRSTFRGITQKHFDSLKRELAIYKVCAKYLELLFAENSLVPSEGLNIEEIRARLKKFDPATVTDVYSRFDEKTQNDITVAVNDIQAEFFLNRPVLYKNKRMIIVADQFKLKQNWQDMSYALLNKILARMLMLGWAQRDSSNNQINTFALTSDSLVDWYTDFRDIGIELKLFDPRPKNTGAKSFLEANLFTYAGNGDDQMTFFESSQYLSMITSGGGSAVGELEHGLVDAGCNLMNEGKDVFGYFWKSESCFKDDFRRNFKKYYAYLPYMVGYVDRMNDQQFNHFYTELMTVARTNVVNQNIKVEYSDLRNISMLLSYIESLFAVADLNYNWAVTATEIRNVYPRFKSFATDYANRVSKDKLDSFRKWNQCSRFTVEDLVRESFIFLVYNGRTPEMSDINYIACLFGSDLISFQGEVDRTRIISTFKVLKEVLESKTK